MNAKCYRTVFNAVRGMLVAVEESARSTGKGRQTGGQAGTSAASTPSAARFAVLPVVFGAWCALGLSYTVHAQVVAAPGSGAQVIQTQNGLQQVNVARPNGSGVSLNTYTQFNVPGQGTILNNAPGITQTQQAGYVNGNPNLLPGGSARIIVNQVTSTQPSTLRGYLEVAGPRAEVVIANPNGILVNGGGFINTSRATLTTGIPVFGGSGSLDAYRVTGGQITVQGAGLNASNVDQVDLIARAVSVNASVYANQLNVVAGANQVDHGTLNATPIAGDGAAPANGIDVSQLGGMYANKILLASTEKGVGVSLRGVAAAQAGDLTLTAQGKLVLAGQTNASGNLSVSAQGGIDNIGTTYGRQSAALGTSGDLTNSGTLAAQQNLRVNANNVASSGTLGAGVNSDGSLAHAGDLSVVAGGTLSATGQNVAGGNATLQGASINLAGSQTSANGNLNLNAQAGKLDLTGATTSAGGALSANAQGALINDRGHLSSQGAATVTAGSLSNQGGQMVSQNALSANVAGALSNQGGTLQAAGALNASAGSLDNTAGHIASLNTDGLNLTTAGRLTNAQGGTIGGNGNVAVQAGQLSNAGTISAVQNLGVSTAQTLANAGTLAANGNTTVSAGTTLTNAGGTIAAGQRANVSAATLDNSAGTLTGNQLALTAATLVNRGGTITQTGTGPIAIGVSGTLDNTGGTLDNTGGAIRTNSADLTLAPATLINDHGTITDSGAGTLSVTTGSLSNNGGTIATNGALDVQAGAVSNQGGKLSAQSQATLNVASLDNRAGGFVGAQSVGITDQGGLNNAGGTVAASGALTVSAGSIANAGGAIKNAGTQATSVSASQSLDNTQGGLIGGNGEVSVSVSSSGGSVDNSGGTVVAGGNAVVQSGGTLRNAAGRVQAKGSAAVTAAGAITNTGGQIEADGAAATLQVTGASLDNTNGRIANAGSGATTVGAASITNANTGGVAGAGTIGGNGDVTVSGQTLSNTQDGQIVAGHDLTLATTRSVNNSGGTLSATNNFTVNAAGAAVVNQGGSIRGNGAVSVNVASLDNTAGKIGNDAGSGGSVAMTTGSLANQGGAIGSDRNLSVTTGQLSGDGRIIAGGDGAITINGNYTHSAANQIQANHNLTFTTTGALTNQGTLAAVNALTVNAASIDNRAGADLNSASTSVNAGGAITNAGRIEGDTVATQSASFANTGTVIGNNVTLNARGISNTGASAALAAATQLNLYASDGLSNTGGATIFSLGDINIAANAVRDGNGLLANRSNLVTNDQSTIEAQGNLEIATQTLNNVRPAPTVQTVTTGTTSTHETKRGKYIACATMNAAPHGGCTQAVWNSGYKTPIDATFSASQIVSQSSGPNPVDNVLVVNVNGQNQAIYYNTLTRNGDGTVSVNYWDAYDPHTNYVPSTEYATRSDGHNGYQRVEIARDTTTVTQQDQVSGGSAPQARLLSGRNMTLANVGTINNNYSAIAAGGSIRIGSSQQGGAVGSGNYGGTTVNNVGRTLYQYQTQNIVSTYAWNEGTNQDVGAVAQAPAVLPPVAIGGTGGTLIANNAVQINATNLNNTNVAAASSSTGATGGTLGANQSAAGVAASGQQTVGAASAQQPAVNAPQSVAGSNGALNISLPTSGLFSLRTAPGQPYLIATDPRLTSYTKFISSDYMLSALNLNPQQVQKRLGDGFYEEKLVRDQITQLTGRVYLQGYGNNEDQYRALMGSGVNAAKQFGLVPGIALTAAQMDALTSDIVWLVNQTVTLPDGSTQQVLAPVVYLAHTHANDLQPTGALIAADDVQIHAVGSATNSGVIKGGTQTVITATDIINRGGTIASDKTRGTIVVSASHDILNASGEISGNRVAAQAGHDIVNTTLVDTVGATAVAGNSKASASLVGRQGSIASTGDLLVRAGNDLTVHGANITAGGNAQVTAGHDIVVDAVQSVGSQSVTQNGQHHWEADSTTHQGSTISAGGSLAMQSGNDTTFKGAKVSAGQDLSVIAGGNLMATTVTDTSKYNNVAADGKARKETSRTYDETVIGTTFSAGHDATFAAVNANAGGQARTDGKGNVTFIGSSVTAGTAQQDSPSATAAAGNPDHMTTGRIDPTRSKSTASSKAGGVTIVADRDVTLAEAREVHDSTRAVSSEGGSPLSSKSASSSDAMHLDVGAGSSVSGNAVHVQAGNDLTVRNSAVVGSGDVSLNAVGGNVLITAGQNVRDESHSFEQKQSGFSGTGGIGIAYGHSGAKGRSELHEVTQSDARSTVGSTGGNVSISAGKDAAIIGSDVMAGSAGGVTGNIDVRAQNIRIEAGQDHAWSSSSQEAHSSGISVGLVGTPLDTLRNQREAQRDPSKVNRVRNTLNEVGAGALDVPQLAIGFNSRGSRSQTSSESLTHSASQLTASGDIRLRATGNGTTDANGRATSGDITVTGSTLSAGGTAALDAQRHVVLQASTDTYQESNSASTSGSHFTTAATTLGDLGRNVGGGPNSSGVGLVPYGSAHSADNAAGSSSRQNASVVIGKSVQVQARTGDITVSGSGISALSDVDLAARQGKVDIVAGTDTSSRHEDHSDRTIGDLGGNGYSGTVGVRSASRTLDTDKRQQSTIRSQVSSAAGNVTIVAGDDVTVHGADVSAGGDLKVTGRNVLLDAGQDAERSHQTESSSQYGATLAMSGYAVSIAQSVEQAGRAVEQHKDPRVAALYLAQAAAMAYNATQSGANSNTTGAGASNVPSAQTQTQAQSSTIIKATVSIGGSSSSSESNASAALNQGSTLRAGQNVTITATGKDASGHVVDGDIVARGSSISGRNVSLDAARDITLESRQDNTHQDSKNSGSNASIGVGLGVGGNQTGFTLELAAGFNRAHADGDAVTHVNSSVNAADTLTLNAGRDANLRGAQASGNTVNATVGRNLNVESRQDIDNYASRSESGGAQVSLCIPPFCIGSTVSGSANLAEGRTDSTYASVVHQSGIAAGTGGYNINVKGNTDLVGGVISSTADPSKNTLRTGTLTTRDVENHAAYSSEQSSVSASYTSGNPLNPDGVPTPLQQGVSNLASNAVGNAQGPIAGNASGTTRSAISTGTVVITDNAGQLAKTGKDAEATVAGLNRDTEHANDGAIGKIFDKQKIEEQQEIARLQAQVVQQVAPLLYKQVGNFLEKQPTEVRVAVHALVGGLISRAMGGEFAAGAAGAGVATLVMETLGKELESSDTLRQLPEKDRKALMQLVSGAIGGIVAGAVSGSGSAAAAAGATSQMAEQFNRQLHPDEQKWIRDHAKEFARQQGISEDQAIERLSQQAAKQVDYLWRAQLSDGDDAAAKSFLSSSKPTFTNPLGEQQKLFTATDQQLLRPEMFADTADPKFYQRYVQSGINRDLNDGLVKEFKDSGIDIKNGAVELAAAVKEHPGIVLNAAWDAVKGLPGAIVDGFRESGQAIGEGAAVALNKDLTDKLNAIYGNDISGYQQALLAIRVTVALTGATTTAKTATGLTEAVVTAVGKKLDRILEKKALDALLDSGGVYDKSGQPLLDMRKLSNEQKGVMGDLFAENTVKRIVPEGEKLARMPAIGEQGIDDLYKVSRADVDYVIIENKFVSDTKKTGANVLGSTADGKQGSTSWVTGSNRLRDAVGLKNAAAVDDAIKAGRTETWVVTTRPDGSTEIQVLDSLGKPKPVDTSKILPPGRNAVGAQP
ncbi:hemagglutinin repeat-containing protein [Ralstonia solanacearum]|uniref:Hemagglutinin repeat-containing protein n=3 Tax=Ralstonia solanacearum TaxID=305 RepID=A0AAE3T475_RALSL|nr:hemagglutinin repeat-containing protein [Ralstonia solanacearum]MDB0521548.1 hemagglutinin repeat-containing protein [Ralstonia solanacearum]